MSSSLNRSAGLASSWSPVEALTATVTMRDNRSSETSVLRSTGQPEDRQPTVNDQQIGNGTLSFQPLSWLTGNLTVSANSQSKSYFFLTAGEGRLEHSVNKTTRYNAVINFTPSTMLGGDLTLTANNSTLGYRVQEDRANAGNGGFVGASP